MKIATPHSETDALNLSRRKLLPAGWQDARILEACEKPSRQGRDMIELLVGIADANGVERQLRDWLTDTTLGAAKLRHACEAVGALARYEAGEIGQADFPGHVCRVRISTEKKKGYPDRNIIEDYAMAAARVVNLRGATS
jgi:hypothetical protein